ncbi:conserved protein of unknown function [Rhodovastum atsumiense]|uniref:Uncharacterized protein n=1 Tax=Rhodovastum atsumiense TaxID=504468 RepID=A0A5M6IT88_9PROT|nr:hypothetical protein [Rhodovastum atsumiense]KAA5610655.1 hypothetical protein F1189_17930 [Rhodovastum atsumiense]CAH2603363.1 conserved protein of unknown function [Rhodovastum atsumiense]
MKSESKANGPAAACDLNGMLDAVLRSVSTLMTVSGGLVEHDGLFLPWLRLRGRDRCGESLSLQIAVGGGVDPDFRAYLTTGNRQEFIGRVTDLLGLCHCVRAQLQQR